MGGGDTTFIHSNDTVKVNGTDIESGKKAPNQMFVYIALVPSILSILISLFNVYKHLVNYTRPELQKPLIRILFIVPFYAIFSWLGLADPARGETYESVRDVWEAVVIYEFLKLVLAYCGGENSCIQVIMKKPGSIAHVWPLNYCLPRMSLDARFMRICKQYTLQFVFVKPVMAAVNVVLIQLHMVSDPTYQMAQMVIYNISYTVALYGLALFYMATHHHPSLATRSPLLKFAAIKLVVFATYYQSLLVALTPGFDRHDLAYINNFILCFEMVIFALMHVAAFGWFEYVGGKVGLGDGMGEHGAGEGSGGGFGGPAGSANVAALGLELGGVGGGASPTRPDQPYKGEGNFMDALRNVKDVVNLGDVARDAGKNFDSTYDSHVELDTRDKGEIPTDHDDNVANPFESAAAAHSANASAAMMHDPFAAPPSRSAAPASSSSSSSRFQFQPRPLSAQGSSSQPQPQQQQQQQDNPFQNSDYL